MTTSPAEAATTADLQAPDPESEPDAQRLGTQLHHVEALAGLRGAAVDAVLFHHAGIITGG